MNDCWWLFGGVPISLITNVKFDGPYKIRSVWIRVTLLAFKENIGVQNIILCSNNDNQSISF